MELIAASASKPTSFPWAAAAPIMILALAFIGYCVADLARHPNARNLPRWAWAIICLVSVPFGGIAYLIWGRSYDR
jgi:Phospholipase_D-nuclease N-terminal